MDAATAALADSATPAIETCNGQDDDGDGKRDEGCSIALAHGSRPILRAGRVAWVENYPTSELWTQSLPDGALELIAEGYVIAADVDDERIVYSTDEDGSFGYTILDLRDRSSQLVKPLDPRGRTLQRPSLRGHWLAYSQDLPTPACGGWCDETEVYLHDLDTGETQLVAGHAGTIQIAPLVSDDLLVWSDDRFGHHIDPVGIEHWYDAMATALPYDGSSYRRLTMAQPRSNAILAFEAGLMLTNLSPAAGLDAYQLWDVANSQPRPLDMLQQGDLALDLSAEYLLVLRDPLGRCHLELVDLVSERGVELDTQGLCAQQGVVDGDFVVWTSPAGTDSDLYWIEIGDLHAR